MKKKKLLIILGCIVLFLIINYFIGGYIATAIVNKTIFDKRGSDVEVFDEDNLEYIIYKYRVDYPNLSVREEYDFKSGKNNLKGYYYKHEDEKGLVLSAHGMGSLADGLDTQYQNWFYENGYSVFAIDLTASGNSEGNSMKGLFQSAYDVKAAYDFIIENNLIKNKFIMVGHSWGAFGISASLSLGVKADYIITFSAYDTPFELMFHRAKQTVGGFADFTYPAFKLSCATYFGNKIFMSASKAIKKSNIKALIFQGIYDTTVPYNTFSVYNRLNDNDNVKRVLLERIDHTTPWLSVESNNKYYQYLYHYQTEITTEEEKEEFKASINKDETTILSDIVIDNINSFLS